MGLADLVVQPYKGAKESGALGFAKGLGRGALGTFFKTGAGTTYPCLRVCLPAFANLTVRGVWSTCVSSSRSVQKHVLDGTYKYEEGNRKRAKSP